MFNLILCFSAVGLITAAIPEEICDKCVAKENCQIFTALNRNDQSEWLHRYSCNEPRHNSETPNGFAATTNGDYICCSDKIWGIDNQTNPATQTPQSRYTYTNNGNNDDPGTNNNYNSNIPNDINSNNQEDSFNNNYYTSPPDNLRATSQQTNENNRQQNGEIDAKRTSNNRNWNQRPNEKRWWNSRKENFDNDKNNKDPRYGNNNRNYNNNQRPDSVRPGPPNDRGNQGTQNNYNSYPHATPNPHFSDGQGNSFRGPGQCDQVMSFPPDPQSGCCGREASDDDRIAGTPNAPLVSAPDHNKYPRNWAPLEDSYYSEMEPLWPFRDEEQRTKRAVDDKNNTVDVIIEDRISGGKETELYQFPWTVLLVTIFDYGNKQVAFSCGGSLISSNYVLTAAHCIYDDNAVVKNIQVYLAEYDKRTFPRDCKASGQGTKCVDNIVMYAENIIRHQQYEEQSLRNDIALIKLKGSAPYTDYIRPICLASINVDDPQFSNLRLTVAGWGRDGPYKTNVKQSTVVNLVPQNECKRSYPELTTRHLCAAGYTGEDTCKGDSGGPLMTLFRGKYYVVGVVSGKRADSPCGTSVPSLYTNVYHYLDWIRNNIRN